MQQPERDLKSIAHRVLLKIPLHDRQKIYMTWNEFGMPTLMVGDRQMLAQVGTTNPAATKGSRIYLREELVEDAPDYILEAIIAHELAHAMDVIPQVDAADKSAHLKIPNKCLLDSSLIEDIVNLRVREWGFKIDEAAQWCDNHFHAE